MLQLFIENEVAENPTCKVRWCVDNNTINYFRDKGVAEPKVLLVVVKEVQGYAPPREHRYMAALTDLAMFVPFTKAGNNKIFATIVWDTPGGKSAETRFLSKDGYDYRTDVLTYDKKAIHKNDQLMYEYAELTVKVDEKLFPKLPADWDWVNLWFSTVSRDQCHHRKRRFLAYSIQPIAMALFFAAVGLYETIAGILCVIGMGCLGLYPGKEDWKYLVPYTDSWNIKWAFQDYREFFTSWYSLPLRPVFLIAAAGIAVLVGVIINATYFWQVVGIGIGVFAAIFIAYVIAGKYAVKPMTKLVRSIDNFIDTLISFMKVKAQERAFRKMVRTSCLFIDKTHPLDIPKEAKTVKLMFDGVKRNVCRPFEEQ